MSDERLWALAFCLFAGFTGAVATQNSPLFPYVTGLSAGFGWVVGWRLGRRRVLNQLVASVLKVGDVQDILDDVGREMLTVWIPLEHELTDDDRQHAHRIGSQLEQHVPEKIARYSAIETLAGAVGVMVIGRHAEVMLKNIRPYFKRHCPRGTYVTRLRLNRDSDELTTWPQPKPLFEDDQLLKNEET